MFFVIGRNGLARQDNPVITLVGVNCSHAHASMGVDPGKDDLPGIQRFQNAIQIGAEKRAVALFDDDDITADHIQPLGDFNLRGTLYIDGYIPVAHLQKCIGKIGFEFLANPDHRPSEGAKMPYENIGVLDQLKALLWFPPGQKTIQHVYDHQDRHISTKIGGFYPAYQSVATSV